ncbi:hypothetical protein [Micromonospora mirobrigensis]|uniref:Uncharacterized protein n=1 Tax=Micromonospora mirobrigensis TaxID=262898 RepID=A0A1C4UDK0_9ACTN|nr:hypothetical protein [Micromonospora mirobrigensis]SCE69734.1 hypothetical protein GA0070564_101401 [Micromonospora mirobrigensis]
MSRWIIHLPTTLTSRETAAGLAAVLKTSLDHVDAIDFGETTLSEEDAQHLRHRVWCDTRLPGGRRCRLGDRHPGPCGTAGEG